MKIINIFYIYDFLISIISFLLAFKLRFSYIFINGNINSDFYPYLSILYFLPFIRLYFTIKNRLYNLKGYFSKIDDFFKILESAFLGTIIIIAVTFLWRNGLIYRSYSYSRLFFIYDFFIYFLITFFSHFILRNIQISIRKNKNKNLIKAIFIGKNLNIIDLIKKNSKSYNFGYKIVKFIYNFDKEKIIDIVKKNSIEEIFLITQNLSKEDIIDLFIKLEKNVEIKVIPSYIGLRPEKIKAENLSNIPILTLFSPPIKGNYAKLKRIFDILVSVLTIILTSPIMLLTAILIKITSKGPVFYVQKRVGMDGRIFNMYKFRSMYINKDDSIHKNYVSELINGNNKKVGNLYKLSDDPRITPIGKFIRKYSIDELPQLFNVLKGDMSIVGPRPPLVYEYNKYNNWHKRRLEVRPGITGLWQVSGRNALNFEQMVDLDIYYIDNWSLLLDLKILFLTPYAVLKANTQ